MRRFLPGKKFFLFALLLLSSLAGLAYWQKAALLSRYHVSRLAHASDADRDACVRRIVELGAPCVPGLLDHLPAGSETTRANVAHALNALAADWGLEDARTESLLKELRETFARCDTEGKGACLTVVSAVLERQPTKELLPAGIAKSSVELLAKAAPVEALLLFNLRLARGFLERVPPGQGTTLCRGLALLGLTRKDAAVRLAAVQVVLQAPLKNDQEMLAKVIPLLKDTKAELRQAALLALAGERDLVGDDDLLALLHDADVEVRKVCELTLRSRGLQDNHILLARLISDRDPSARLLVLAHLDQSPDLEPGVWLQRLSSDPAPAVRAAAIRAAAGQKQIDLRGRLHEMSRDDPSLSVRQLAGFYLTRGLSRFVED